MAYLVILVCSTVPHTKATSLVWTMSPKTRGSPRVPSSFTVTRTSVSTPLYLPVANVSEHQFLVVILCRLSNVCAVLAEVHRSVQSFFCIS